MTTQSVRHRGAARLRVSYRAGRSGAATVLGRLRDRIPLDHAKHSLSATAHNEKCELGEIALAESIQIFSLFFMLTISISINAHLCICEGKSKKILFLFCYACFSVL